MKGNFQAFLAKIYLKTLESEYVDTIKKREKLLKKLEKALKKAEEAEDWKLVGFICQTINSILNSYDETRFNEDVQRLKRLIEDAKKRIGQVGAGTPVS